RPAAQPSFALAGKPDARPVLNAGRNVHGQCARLADAAGARTFRARVGDDLAAAVAGRTGALDMEEAALAGANAPRAIACMAGLWAGARFGASSRADAAGYGGRHLDLDRLPRERLLQRHF